MLRALGEVCARTFLHQYYCFLYGAASSAFGACVRDHYHTCLKATPHTCSPACSAASFSSCIHPHVLYPGTGPLNHCEKMIWKPLFRHKTAQKRGSPLKTFIFYSQKSSSSHDRSPPVTLTAALAANRSPAWTHAADLRTPPVASGFTRMPRRNVCAALAIAVAAAIPTSTLGVDPWVTDYQQWMQQISTSVAGNAELSKRAVELQSSLDAAVASGASEADRMRLLYDFLAVADADPSFQGFSLSEPTPAATTAAPSLRSAAPAPAALASATALAATVVVSYALL